jgi:flagellar basal body rod protein FlgC
MRVVVTSAAASWRRTSMTALSARRQGSAAAASTSASFSTKAATTNNNDSRLVYQPVDSLEYPGGFVTGVTKEMLHESADMQSFYRANFGAPATPEQMAQQQTAHDQQLRILQSTIHKAKPPKKIKGLGRRRDPAIEQVQISDADWARIVSGELVDADELFGYDNDEDADGEDEDEDDNAGYVAEPVEPYYKVMVEGDGVDNEGDNDSTHSNMSMVELPKRGAKGRAARIREPNYPRNIRPMKAYVRHVEGTRACRRLREHERLIPGMLSGDSKKAGGTSLTPTPIMTPHYEIHRERDKFFNYFESHVYNLTVWESPEAEQAALLSLSSSADGEGSNDGNNIVTEDTPGVVYKINVVLTDYQKHPFLEKHTCLNFLKYHPLRSVNLPVRFINEEESPALKRGAFVVPNKRFVPCLIEDGCNIPDFLDLDCTGLQVKNTLRLDRVIFPPGVQYSKKHLKHPHQWLAGSVFGKASGGGADDDDDAAAGGDEKKAA